MVMSTTRSKRWLIFNLVAVGLLVASSSIPAQAATGKVHPKPIFSNAVAHDVSPPLSVLAARYQAPSDVADEDVREERGDVAADTGYQGDDAVQTQEGAASIPSATSFEGLRNTNNPNGILVNPPDPVGDIGPNNYVEMVNLVFGIYDRSGNLLLGPTPIGALWDGFAVPDCTDLSGDPVVLYDQFVHRWILSQFTTSGLTDPTKPFWNCVAISTSDDPTGAYYRYAFETKNFQFFPDYPKYGVWTDSYVLTTREFGPTVEYGIGVYALEKNKMVNGEDARAVSFFIDGNDPAHPETLPLIGDGLLPADIDGMKKPGSDEAVPLVGTQDDGGPYGATFDALNIWDLKVHWRSTPTASLELNTQLTVSEFDSIFPCAPTARDCLPQPGVTDPARYLDILSYRQRPTYRLAFRNFKAYEALVTNQSVEALPGVAGVRWYEIRRTGGTYSLFQEGTYAPNDGVHRWMGSIAQDRKGNAALGFSVVNATNVFPGIRYTGRLAGDTAGEMTLGEGTIINGTGVQLTTNSRWGDYTSMNVDPVDDCTFWYVNEYYETTDPVRLRNWQTRIANFELPGC